MAASTSNQSFYPNQYQYQYQYQYPYPSHVFVHSSFITVKLNGKSTYNVWNYQMLSLLKSHGMFGFINGYFVSPQTDQKATVEDIEAWNRSDSLVCGWILSSLSDQVAINVVNRLTSGHTNNEFTAKDAWDELKRIYGPALLEQPAAERGIMIRNDWRSEYNKQIVVELKSEQEIAELQQKAEQQIADQQIAEQQNAEKQIAEKQLADQQIAEHKLLERQSAVGYTDKTIAQEKKALYSQIVRGNFVAVREILKRQFVHTLDILTSNGDTTLHVAVGSSTNNPEILSYLLEMVPDINLLYLRNSDGSTLLHVAIIVGNTKAAKILLQRSPDLLLVKDNKGQAPLAISLSNMHIETSRYMLRYIQRNYEEKEKYDALFTGPRGEELVVLAISSKDFRFAIELLKHSPKIHSEAMLMALAQNFPSYLGFWERLADDEVFHFYKYEPDEYTYIAWATEISRFFSTRECCVHFKRSIKIITMAIAEKFYHWNSALLLLVIVCNLIKGRETNTHHLYYSNAVFEATRKNAYKVVTGIIDFFPKAIWELNEDGHTFIQHAVVNRSEKIYNLLYKMSQFKNIYKTMEDSSGNNLLHLAARLAPANKFENISGAALQMQRELQWFKEVEGFICPLYTMKKNSAGETPEMVFSREHKELVIEGEEWMKKTAESYTITAALITTIVFAAAITVPGGNDQNKGTPLFTNKPAFTIFAISDAVSLLTAVASLLMFLSILTTRFSEKDFLFKLPKRLIMGLSMLFISTTAMIIAFGATLFLVFGQGNLWVLIPIGALTCLPIISFVTLQFPFIMDLISSTYGRSIFDKTKPDEPFY